MVLWCWLQGNPSSPKIDIKTKRKKSAAIARTGSELGRSNQWTISISDKTSHHEIFWRFKPMQFDAKITISLWNLAGGLVIMLARCLPNFRVIRKPWRLFSCRFDFKKSYNKASYIILKHLLGFKPILTHCSMFRGQGQADIGPTVVPILSYINKNSALIDTFWTTLYQHSTLYLWVRSRNCGCLVNWFCYQLIAKPGNKTAAVSWPDQYIFLALIKH